jgi:peptidoglycan hydrolase-like protein with peptidoglycan-binding domain
MARNIKASVGMINGRQCYNLVEDQVTVIELLNSIPASNGGRREDPLPDARSGLRQGVVSSNLHKQILQFQRRHSLSIDGHVDPGFATIGKLNALANTDPRPGITIAVEKAVDQLPHYIDTAIRALLELVPLGAQGQSSLSELAGDALRRFFRSDPATSAGQGEVLFIIGRYRTLRQALNALKSDLNINDPVKDLKSQSEAGDKATAAYAVMSDNTDEKAGIYINPSAFEPLNELRRTGILLHEMCHFYLQMPEDRDPRRFSALQNIIGTVQSYDLTAFQINFGRLFREDIK